MSLPVIDYDLPIVTRNQKTAEAASHVLHFLDRSKQRRSFLLLALAGALVTFLMWWFHFSYPDVEGALRERAGRLLLLAEFAPPFAMVFGLGRALIHKAPSEPELSGPMSAYLYQQDARKKWKVMILAATAAVANLMLMMVTA